MTNLEQHLRWTKLTTKTQEARTVSWHQCKGNQSGVDSRRILSNIILLSYIQLTSRRILRVQDKAPGGVLYTIYTTTACPSLILPVLLVRVRSCQVELETIKYYIRHRIALGGWSSVPGVVLVGSPYSCLERTQQNSLLDSPSYLYKCLLVCAPVSHNHMTLTNNYMYYIILPMLFISFPHYIPGYFPLD